MERSEADGISVTRAVQSAFYEALGAAENAVERFYRSIIAVVILNVSEHKCNMLLACCLSVTCLQILTIQCSTQHTTTPYLVYLKDLQYYQNNGVYLNYI